MIYLKTNEEIELLRESSLLVGKTLAEVAKLIKPGVSTLDLDKVAEEFIRDNGAVPGFKGYGGFPNSLCTVVTTSVLQSNYCHDMPAVDQDEPVFPLLGRTSTGKTTKNSSN